MNKETLRHDQIYSFEHSHLQAMFESNPADFVRTAMERSDFIYSFWELLEGFTGMSFGFTPEMFKQRSETIENVHGYSDIAVVSVEFPTPVKATECYRAFIVCEKDKPETAKMYMLEKAAEMPFDLLGDLSARKKQGADGKPEKAFLCRWEGESMNKEKTRHDQIYTFEHCLLQRMFETDPAAFILTTMETKEFIYRISLLLKEIPDQTSAQELVPIRDSMLKS